MATQGPFVHLSSIIAHMMSKLVTTVNRVYAVSQRSEGGREGGRERMLLYCMYIMYCVVESFDGVSP